MRILIVEDDEKSASALASGLDRGGFSTATAHSGEEGFFLLSAETFDLAKGCCKSPWPLPPKGLPGH
jgi:DNA-binding response OmpR family regulator